MTITSQDVPDFPSGNNLATSSGRGLSIGAKRALGDPCAGIPREALAKTETTGSHRPDVDPFADNMGSSRYGGGR